MNRYLNYKKAFGLYMHIPFCQSKCNYCDFYSIKYTPQKMREYVDMLKKEIELYADKLINNRCRTIYLGGGTPSLLSPQLIEEILITVFNSFNVVENVEISMEANPESLTECKIKAYREMGINRLSLGIQSFLDEELKFLGRSHDVIDSINAIIKVEKHFDNYNIDLIFALFRQTFLNFVYSLNQVLDFNPSHISLYKLQIEDGTKLYKRFKDKKTNLISEELDYKMYNHAIKKLQEAGYNHYEISNFSRDEHRSKHNIIYWKYEPYLGLGPAAHGFNGKQRYKNYSNFRKYIYELKKGRLPVQDIIKLNKKEMIFESMFMGLRLTEGIDVEKFKSKFDVSIFDIYDNVLQELKEDNLIVVDKKRIYLTKKGLNLANLVFSKLIL